MSHRFAGRGEEWCHLVRIGTLSALLLASRPVSAMAQAASPTTPPVSPGVLTPPTGSRVKAGFLVRPDTVEVGDPFTLIVTVVVPDGARVEWPTIDDTTAMVVSRQPTKVTQESMRAGGRTERAEYALAAWNVGPLPIGLNEAIVRYGSITLKVPLNASVFVKSVLPGDSSMHKPKPPRDLFPRLVPWWQRWWPVLLVLAALALLWWLLKRRRKRGNATAYVALDPYARAVHDFDRLDRLALADAGERGRYVALAIDVVRTYLALRNPLAALSLTSSELIGAIADDERVPRDRLISLMADGDGIKFARRLVSGTRARELAADARAVVDHIEAAERARRTAEEAARAAAAKADRDATQKDEDDARRKSRRPKAGAT
ncbi:hypothetical protein [Gemmatimonas sp.]|uniref:hypothetical protein n=1 Tax=Gemmatimonas sp. TaxID=1962908 RepID=UPI0039836F14